MAHSVEKLRNFRNGEIIIVITISKKLTYGGRPGTHDLDGQIYWRAYIPSTVRNSECFSFLQKISPAFSSSFSTESAEVCLSAWLIEGLFRRKLTRGTKAGLHRGLIRNSPKLSPSLELLRCASGVDHRQAYTRVIDFLHKYVRLALPFQGDQDCLPTYCSIPLSQAKYS